MQNGLPFLCRRTISGCPGKEAVKRMYIYYRPVYILARKVVRTNYWQYGIMVAQLVGYRSWTCDQEVQGLKFTAYLAVTLSDWVGNRRSGVSIAVQYRLQWPSHLLKSWRGRGSPAYACVEYIWHSLLYLCGWDFWSQFVIKTLSPDVAMVFDIGSAYNICLTVNVALSAITRWLNNYCIKLLVLQIYWGSWGPDPPASTCGTCDNRADAVTLSGGGVSRDHPMPVNFWTLYKDKNPWSCPCLSYFHLMVLAV